jgi:hypothetical protein
MSENAAEVVFDSELGQHTIDPTEHLNVRVRDHGEGFVSIYQEEQDHIFLDPGQAKALLHVLQKILGGDNA